MLDDVVFDVCPVEPGARRVIGRAYPAGRGRRSVLDLRAPRPRLLNRERTELLRPVCCRRDCNCGRVARGLTCRDPADNDNGVLRRGRKAGEGVAAVCGPRVFGSVIACAVAAIIAVIALASTATSSFT